MENQGNLKQIVLAPPNSADLCKPVSLSHQRGLLLTLLQKERRGFQKFKRAPANALLTASRVGWGVKPWLCNLKMQHIEDEKYVIWPDLMQSADVKSIDTNSTETAANAGADWDGVTSRRVVCVSENCVSSCDSNHGVCVWLKTVRCTLKVTLDARWHCCLCFTSIYENTFCKSHFLGCNVFLKEISNYSCYNTKPAQVEEQQQGRRPSQPAGLLPNFLYMVQNCTKTGTFKPERVFDIF